jgi:hypothetical protein
MIRKHSKLQTSWSLLNRDSNRGPQHRGQAGRAQLAPMTGACSEANNEEYEENKKEPR